MMIRITLKQFSAHFSRVIKMAVILFFSYEFTNLNEVCAQNRNLQKTITINPQSQTIKEVMDNIEEQTSFSFFYNNLHLDLKQPVSMNYSQSTLAEVLDQLLQKSDLTYKIHENTIVLMPKSVKNDNIIRGRIVDRNNYPIIGANIIEVGNAKNGTTTNLDGNFVLQVSSSDAAIEISYIGFTTETVVAKTNTDMNIVLHEDTKQLDATVVVGYGSQNKKTMTGAASVVTTKDMELGTVTSISHALSGKAAGFNVSRISAQPGGASSFTIRGAASTGAGNAPLFVVDGFPITDSPTLDTGFYSNGSTDSVLESLNPDDIESITILKDAATTAIYGARAGHGVILITTKRGKNLAPRVTYSGVGAVQVARTNFEMLSIQEYMEWINIQHKEEWMKANGQGIYADYIKAPEEVPAFVPDFTQEQIDSIKGTDWLDGVTRIGYMHQHNLSVNGGTETTRYLASMNLMQQEGIVKNNGVGRLSARVNLDQDLGKYVTLSLTSNFSHNTYDNIAMNQDINEWAGVISSAVIYNPTISIRDDNGEYMLDPRRPFAPNPVSLLEVQNGSTKNRLTGSAYVTVRPVKGLELKANFGADLNAQKQKSYLPKTTLQGKNYNGKATVSHNMACDYLMDLTAEYSNTWGGHSFKALGGYSFSKTKAEGFMAENSDFLIDGFGYNNIGAGNYPKPLVGSWAGVYSLSSLFTRMNYSYAGRYVIEATLCANAASNFHPDHRWGLFPSISAAWLISEENFMSDTRNWLSNMKLRASYGQTGNSNVGYRVEDTYAVGLQSVIGNRGVPTVYANSLGNPNITWETTSEVNIGLDLGFLKDRIRLSAEYYFRIISDLLVVNRPLPSYNEVATIAGNSGATQSQGFEITLKTVNFEKEDFGWNTDLTLSHYEDCWRERDSWWKPAPYQNPNDPIRAVWEYHALGVMRPGETAPEAQKNLLPGQMKLQDVNKDNVIDQEDLIFKGTADPRLILGFNNSLRYNNFDFSIYFYGQLGAYRGMSYYEAWTSMINNINSSNHVKDVFYSGNVASKNPSFIITTVSSQTNGDWYSRRSYFIRCGNITMGYRFPFKNSYLKSMRVYFDLNNPIVITDWTGLDPETDNGSFPYPNVTSFNLGLSVSF